MKCVGSGFGDYVNLASAEFSVFGVEITGENPELSDGIQVRNDRRAVVDVFFHIASVHDEGVCELPLAVNGNGAGIQIAGGTERAGTYVLNRLGRDGSNRSHSRLK